VKAGIFIKSCKRDFLWLTYCLRTLEKFWKRPRPKILLALDKGCAIPPACPEKECLFLVPWADGYTHAMVVKATADLLMPGCDPILLLDSDTMFTGPCSLDDMIEDGKLMVQYARWEDDDSDTRRSAKQVWVPAVREAIGVNLDADFMVSTPCIYWRNTFERVRELVETKHGKPFMEALRSDVAFEKDNFLNHPFTFCENECLGYVASLQDRYILQDFRHAGKIIPLRQFWSHGRFPIAYLETLLASAGPTSLTPRA